MKREKRIILGAGLFAVCLWGGAGFALGQLEGASLTLLYIGLLACVAHTIGSLWRYFTLDE